MTDSPLVLDPRLSTVHVLQSEDHKVQLRTTALGCATMSLHIPNAQGESINVLLGYPKASEYLGDTACMGFVAGQVCNRLPESGYEIGKERFYPYANEIRTGGKNSLHGGQRGFSKVLWTPTTVGPNQIVYKYSTKHLDEGHPGPVHAQVIYQVFANGLRETFIATADRLSVVNLTNHRYWNLAGVRDDGTASAAQLKDHSLLLNASKYAAVDGNMIPTGEFPSVDGTVLDLRELRTLKEILKDKSLRGTEGLDHHFMINRDLSGDPKRQFVGSLACPTSGIKMDVYTTQPGVQIYTGNFLNGRFEKHSGICFETQAVPNAVNIPLLRGSVIVFPGMYYQHTTEYIFSTESTLGPGSALVSKLRQK